MGKESNHNPKVLDEIIKFFEENWHYAKKLDFHYPLIHPDKSNYKLAMEYEFTNLINLYVATETFGVPKK